MGMACWEKGKAHEQRDTKQSTREQERGDAETKQGTYERNRAAWLDKARHMREQEEHDAETKQGTWEQEQRDSETKKARTVTEINSSRALIGQNNFYRQSSIASIYKVVYQLARPILSSS